MGVELLGLVGNDTGQLKDTGLERGTELSDTVVGLLLGGSDVLNRLSETLALEELSSVQGSVHAGRGVRQGSVGVSAVLGHGGADIVELLGGLGSDLLDLVVSPVAELLVHGVSLGSELGAALLGLGLDVGHLVVEGIHGMVESRASLLGVRFDLGSVHGNVLVGLLDLGVGSRGKGGKSALLVLNGLLKLLSTLGLVLGHDLTGLHGASDGLLVTLVLKGSSLSELTLGQTHGVVKVVLGDLRIHSHLGEKRLLHLLASISVVLHVLGHLGADGGDVGLARLHLLSNVSLDLVQEGEQTLTAFLALLESVGGLGVQETRLHHVGRVDGLRIEYILARAGLVLLSKHDLISVRCDVHNAAADGEAAQENK